MSAPGRRVTAGQMIRAARQARRWTQQQVAAQVGCTMQHLSSIELDRGSGVSVELLRHVAAVLSIDSDVLLLAADRVPPDVMAALQRAPAELCGIIREYTERRR